ncbi:MAG: PaaI family thioesterase [Deltaproteobacteria bacterium]|nr:PaaI family thioesterase [Deltaproteobacteria bacterium]
MKSFQDYYPDDFAICYGCGRLNEHGLKLKSYWEDDESVCRFQPQPYHTGGHKFVYGGLIASLTDCHGAATASAEKHRREGRQFGTGMFTRFVTASLHVDFLAPVPIDGTIVLRAKVDEVKGRKSVVGMTLFVDDKACAKGNMVAIQIPDDFLDR